MDREVKKLQALIDVTYYLAEHNFAYDDTGRFIDLLKSEIPASRDCNEYVTAEDGVDGIPCCDIKTIVIPLNKNNVATAIYDVK